MANKKALQNATVKFKKEHPSLCNVYSTLCSKMALFIAKTGAPEVTVGFKNGRFYGYAND